METIERDYSAKGVKFYYIYKALAHPETNGYVTPFDLKERLMHIAEAKRTLDSRFTWLCDSMANDLKHALGDAPNSEFIVNSDGKLVRVRRWSNPAELRADLEELVGPVASPTSVADLGRKPLPPPRRAKTGVVPRIELPGRMTPVRSVPQVDDASETPFYAKLRAEVDTDYLARQRGQLYLGFLLDPLYAVHWNNRAAALEFSIEPPAGIEIAPALGKGPEVREPADADPREFLLQVSGHSEEPLRLTVKYFACDDAETFCKPVTQQYNIWLDRDPDGGNRRTPGSGGPPARQPRGIPNAGPAPAGGRGGEIARMFRQFDANGDGKLSKSEAPPRMLQRWQRMDANGDGFVDADEQADVLRRIRGQ